MSNRWQMSKIERPQDFDTWDRILPPMAALTELLGDSPGMRLVRDEVQRLLKIRRLPTVLIQGETRTGKTVLARWMHRASERRAGPFIDVNSKSVPESL